MSVETNIDSWALLGAILSPVAVWLGIYFRNRLIAARAAELTRLNRQLKEFYGPLYLALIAGDTAWEAFWSKHAPAHGKRSYFPGDDPTESTVSDTEKAVWRQWMLTVFHPLNQQIADLIMQNGDLMDEPQVPQAFKDVLGHIQVYNIVLEDWANGEFANHTSTVNFPATELLRHVEPVYRRLRARQHALLMKDVTV